MLFILFELQNRQVFLPDPVQVHYHTMYCYDVVGCSPSDVTSGAL
jgi:hypothetical protein